MWVVRVEEWPEMTCSVRMLQFSRYSREPLDLIIERVSFVRFEYLPCAFRGLESDKARRKCRNIKCCRFDDPRSRTSKNRVTFRDRNPSIDQWESSFVSSENLREWCACTRHVWAWNVRSDSCNFTASCHHPIYNALPSFLSALRRAFSRSFFFFLSLSHHVVSPIFPACSIRIQFRRFPFFFTFFFFFIEALYLFTWRFFRALRISMFPSRRLRVYEIYDWYSFVDRCGIWTVSRLNVRLECYKFYQVELARYWPND